MFEFYPSYEATFAQVQLVLFMLGMGLTLSPRDFVQVVRQPRSLLTALSFHVLLMPVLAVAINHLFGLDGGIALGLILTSAMPGGTLAKAFTYLARGNVPLAISLSLVSTLGTLVTVPVTLSLVAREYIPPGFAMPVAAIVFDVGVFLLLPILVGMVLGHWLPEGKTRLSRLAIRTGFLVVIAVVVCSLGSGRIKPGEHGWWVPLAIIAFGLAGMQLAMLPFRIGGWPRADTVTVGIEVTMRNMNLALLLKTVLFPEDGSAEALRFGAEMMFVILFYAAAAMGEGLPLALRFRRKAQREDRKTAEPAHV